MPIIIILTVFFVLGQIINLNNLAVSDSSPWWTLFTFNFVHVSFLHYLINVFIFYTYSRVLNKKDILPVCILSLVITPIAAYLTAQSVPTCGFSAVISVIMGYYLTKVSRKFFFKAMALILFSYVFTYLCSKGVNTGIHAVSFFTSLAVSFVWRKYGAK